MKFEKLGKDKIKVTLNKDDLHANDVDSHSFMCNSEESHSLVLNVLEKAERDYGFSTKDYNLKVETIALSNGSFILTITRAYEPGSRAYSSNMNRKKLKVYRKTPKSETSSALYKFNSFEDFCDLVNELNSNNLIDYKQISKNTILYAYNDAYYLFIDEVNIKFPNLKSLFATITEFGTYMESTDIFTGKLFECGTIIFKEKAIENCIKHFV